MAGKYEGLLDRHARARRDMESATDPYVRQMWANRVAAMDRQIAQMARAA